VNLNKCPIIGGYVAGIKNLFKNGEKTHQFYQWFEDKAECFRPTKEELHADEKDWKKIEQIMKPRKQQCFYNSWQVALIDDSFNILDDLFWVIFNKVNRTDSLSNRFSDLLISISSFL